MFYPDRSPIDLKCLLNTAAQRKHEDCFRDQVISVVAIHAASSRSLAKIDPVLRRDSRFH
jgi:hypothetical protein